MKIQFLFLGLKKNWYEFTFVFFLCTDGVEEIF
jgi:hypothetical protein